MKLNRLDKIKLVCHNCSYSGHLNYDLLNKKLGSYEPLSLKNIGELLHYFLCSKCRAKNFELHDANGEILFDTNNNVDCEICETPIPYPRLSSLPGTRRCVSCQNSNEKDTSDVKFPDIPQGLRGKCPSCKEKRLKGIVVVYQNGSDKTFFLGCSSFPSCRWSSSKYFDELNKR
jgi:Zn finger protein HypA/HybF involved in hydrogenase expression